MWTKSQCKTVEVCVVLFGGGYLGGFASDDSRLSSWQSRGLACVTQSNCRRLVEPLSGTLAKPKANCRPDKDKRPLSFLTGSSYGAKFTTSSLIPGQSDCRRIKAWWVSGLSVLSWGHKCIFHLESAQAFLYMFHSWALSPSIIASCDALCNFKEEHWLNYCSLLLINTYFDLLFNSLAVDFKTYNFCYIFYICWQYLKEALDESDWSISLKTS